MRKFCAKCGREESQDSPLIQGLCTECFISTKKLIQLPEQIEVVRCHICGAIKSRGGRFTDIDLSKYVRDLVEGYTSRGKTAEGVDQVTITSVSLQEGEAVVEVDGVAGGAVLSQVLKVRVVPKSVVCPQCFKYKTKRYEALVQLRPGNPRASVLVSRIAREFRERPEVLDVEECDEGIDVYMAEKSAAARMVREIESNYVTKVVSTWEGSKYGRRKPKAVFSVRVYEVSRGDLVELQSSLYEVVEAGPQTVVLRDLRTGKVLSFSLNSLWRRNPTFLDRR